jgi:hypothetical protein
LQPFRTTVIAQTLTFRCRESFVSQYFTRIAAKIAHAATKRPSPEQ